MDEGESWESWEAFFLQKMISFPWTKELRGAGEAAYILRDLLWVRWRRDPEVAVRLDPDFRDFGPSDVALPLNHNSVKRALYIMQERGLLAVGRHCGVLTASLSEEDKMQLWEARYGPEGPGMRTEKLRKEEEAHQAHMAMRASRRWSL